MPSPLLQALYQRQNERVDEILAANPELDIFEAAALGNQRRVVQLLVNDGSVAAAIADDGFHPLHLAAYFGHSAIAQLLIERGADVNAMAANSSEVRPIHSAIAARQLAVARVLLEAGAKANVKQAGGWTPLHSAAHQGNIDAVELLLAHGADPEQQSHDGRTPADMAAEVGRQDVVAMLRQPTRPQTPPPLAGKG